MLDTRKALDEAVERAAVEIIPSWPANDPRGQTWRKQARDILLAASYTDGLREALSPFATAHTTSRKMVPGSRTKPELDEMTVTVTAGDWIRACVALGRQSAEYLRLLPDSAQPSEEFIASLAPYELVHSEDQDD